MSQLYIHETIYEQLRRQLQNFFADIDLSVIEGKIDEAYERCIAAISVTNNKYLNPDGIPRFMLEHSGCWSIFLYYLSNSLRNIPGGAETVYYLNKILHSVDWFYEIELPSHFMVEHPLGSVLGRADYGDFLFIYQGVTVGGNISSSNGVPVYPTLGNNIILFSDAKVLGDVHVGNNVIFGANSYVINEDIPDDSMVFGMSPNMVIKHEPEKIKEYMKRIWKQN